MKLNTALLVLVISLPFSTPSAEPRKWSDRTGDFSVMAEFIRFKNEKVYLEKADGEVISIPIEELSYADYDFLRTLSEMRGYFRENPLPTQHTLFQVRFDRGFEFVTFSPDSRFIAGATDYGLVMLNVESESHVLTRVSDKSISYLNFAKFTPDGKTLVAHAGVTKRITTWNVAADGRLTNERIFPLAESNRILCMAFHPDGKYVLSGDEGDNLCYWDLETGKIKYLFEDMFGGDVEGCYINPKGTQAVATDGEFAILFDLKLGKPVQKMKLCKTDHYRAALSEDGRRTFAEYSGTVYGWTTLDGQQRLQIKPRGSGPVWKVVTSADGSLLLIGRTNTADLWNSANAQHIHNYLTIGGGNLRVMAISPDNRRIAVASGTGEKHLQIFRNPSVSD